jgi:TatD-related deoxyribonuclease
LAARPPSLPADLPVVDHHCHLAPTGEGVAAARRFRISGGTHLFLATQNYAGTLPTALSHYEKQFATTIDLAGTVEREVGIRVYPVVAPYPVDLIGQVTEMGGKAAVELQSSALDLAGRLVREKQALALGEVGRPHFPIADELSGPVEEVLQHALEVGRDASCPVVLHTEDLGPLEFRSLAALAARTMFPVRRLVKHYQRSVLPTEQYLGIAPSYLARRELVEAAVATRAPWFLETDFLDDPARPGAVLDLATVPRRATALISRDPANIERLRVPFQESVRSVYGFTPELSQGRPT